MLPRKREKPRRKVHPFPIPGSQKPAKKVSREPTAEEKRFHAWVREKGCQVPGCGAEASFHHEKFLSQGGNHQSGIGLCPFHHQDQKFGRHAMSRDRFNLTYKMDVLSLASENWTRFGKE